MTSWVRVPWLAITLTPKPQTFLASDGGVSSLPPPSSLWDTRQWKPRSQTEDLLLPLASWDTCWKPSTVA